MPMGEEADNPKSRLRRELGARRRRIPAGDLAGAGGVACGHLAATAEFRRARHVVLYAARVGEVDPRPLEAHAGASGAATYYPCVEGEQLAFRRAAFAELKPGRFGVPEPARAAPLLDPATDDIVVIVPGLAFDRRGGRLGTGRGYYDRALPALPGALRVGLALQAFVVDRIPTEPWDVPVHAIVTERGLIRADRDVGAPSGEHPWTFS